MQAVPQLSNIRQVSDGWIKKYVLAYTMPDGSTYEYESASRKSLEAYRAELEGNAAGRACAADAVCIVPQTATGELLLIREFRYPLNSWCIAFPAGLMEPGEDLATCVDRELREETGYALRADADAPALDPLPQAGYSSTGLTDETVHVVFAQVEKVADAQPEPAEFIEPFLLPIATSPVSSRRTKPHRHPRPTRAGSLRPPTLVGRDALGFLVQPEKQLGLRVDVQLAVQVAHVRLHRGLAHHQLLGDVGRTVVLRQQHEYLALARRQVEAGGDGGATLFEPRANRFGRGGLARFPPRRLPLHDQKRQSPSRRERRQHDHHRQARVQRRGQGRMKPDEQGPDGYHEGERAQQRRGRVPLTRALRNRNGVIMT